jgi:transposase
MFYRSFDNRKQLATYVSLTPAHFQSGGSMCRDLSITKGGDAKARTVMIELAGCDCGISPPPFDRLVPRSH